MSIPRSLALVTATIACACGGGSPQPVVMPPLHVTATPPAAPPVRARWVFSHPERGFAAKMDLGDGSTLYVGNNGRRELGKGDAPLVDAGTLALADLVGVIRDDKKQLVFVGDDGDTYTATDPLGELSAAKTGPLGTDPKPGANKLVSTTTGKSSIVAISPDRKLMRSADFGATWKAVDYAGATKPYGKPVAVALDEKGNGLLLHLPQRLFATKDDGATWTPLVASPGIGARRVFRDGAGKIFLEGYGGARAKLDGGALAVTTEEPTPIYKPAAKGAQPSAGSSKGERGERKTILTGDHAVELTAIERKGKTREIEILSIKLGEKATEKDKPVVSTDLVGAEGLSDAIAGWGSSIVYLRQDDDSEAETATSTLFRSKDYGATWAKESVLQGSEPTNGEGTAIAVGPKGWTYVTSLCPNEHDDEAPSSGDCAKRQIKPANAAAFEDMVFVEEFAPQSFAFDEAHDRVYALGTHDSNMYVYESPLSQNKFTRTKLLADVGSGTRVAVGVDAKGVLRAMEYDYSKKQWVLHRRGADGKDMPPMYAGLDRGDMSFVGARGILFAGHRGFETNDGGESWIRIATNGSTRDFTCTESGCLNGEAQRFGWDLPAVTTGDKVAAQAEPIDKTTKPSQLPPATPGPTMDLTCKPTGAATPLTFVPGTELLDGRSPDMRWASIKNESDGRTSIVVGTKNAVKTLPLVAAEPKPAAPAPGAKAPPPMEHRQGQRTLPDGVIAARYAFAPANGGPYNPVDVDLTWWSSVTGKTQHKLLAKVKPFRVSRYGLSGAAQIVDGGMLFQPARGEPAFYVHDDGKVENITLPANAGIDNAERVGKRWLVTDWDGWTARTNVSDDNGATWKQKAWGLDEYGSITLTAIGGKATLNLTHAGNPALLFGLDGALPDDPPAPIVVDANLTTDVACDAQSGRQKFVNYLPYDHRTVKARIEETNKTVTALSASTRITHDLANGKQCTSAYALTGAQTAFIYPEAKGWSGWRFRRNVDPKEKQATWFAEALTCQ